MFTHHTHRVVEQYLEEVEVETVFRKCLAIRTKPEGGY